LVTSPLIEAGEYSYYDDPVDATAFETRNVLLPLGPEKFDHRGDSVRSVRACDSS